MERRTKLIGMGAAAAALLGVTVWLMASTPSAPSEVSSDGEAMVRATSYEVRYEVLQWDSRIGTDEPARLLFEGAMTLAGQGVSRRVTLDGIERLDVSLGQDVDLDLAALRGSSASLTLTSDGRLDAFDPDVGVTPEAEHLLRSLAEELSAPTQSGEVEVLSPRGVALDRATRRGSATGYTLATERLGYAQVPGVSAQAQVRVEGARSLTYREGHQLEQADVHETLEVQDGELALRVEVSLRVRGSRPHFVAAADAAPQTPEEVEAAQLERHRLRMLEARAEGLSVAALADAIASAGEAGRIPDHATFAWRATALLALDPEACAAVAEIFLDADTPHGARLLVLDLLAQADGEAAQAALRRVLDDPSIRGSEREADLLGHLILLQRADADVLTMLSQRAAGTDPEVSRAAAYALGSALHVAGPAGAESTSAHQVLMAALDTALDAEDDAALTSALDALGNAGWEGDVDAIAGAASERSTGVRVAAARALRRVHTPAAQGHLARMLDDDEPAVRAEAMTSMMNGGLDAAGFEYLTHAAAREGLASAEVSTLVNLASTGAQTHPQQTQALLAALLSHRIESRQLRIQAEGLAARLAHGG